MLFSASNANPRPHRKRRRRLWRELADALPPQPLLSQERLAPQLLPRRRCIYLKYASRGGGPTTCIDGTNNAPFLFATGRGCSVCFAPSSPHQKRAAPARRKGALGCPQMRRCSVSCCGRRRRWGVGGAGRGGRAGGALLLGRRRRCVLPWGGGQQQQSVFNQLFLVVIIVVRWCAGIVFSAVCFSPTLSAFWLCFRRVFASTCAMSVVSESLPSPLVAVFASPLSPPTDGLAAEGVSPSFGFVAAGSCCIASSQAAQRLQLGHSGGLGVGE